MPRGRSASTVPSTFEAGEVQRRVDHGRRLNEADEPSLRRDPLARPLGGRGVVHPTDMKNYLDGPLPQLDEESSKDDEHLFFIQGLFIDFLDEESKKR